MLFCCTTFNANAVSIAQTGKLKANISLKCSSSYSRQQLVPNPPAIAGTYKAVSPEGSDEDNDACDLYVQIRKANGVYFYTLHVASKVYKGKVKLEKGDNRNEFSITFSGIRWAEYEGDVSRVDDDSRPVHMKIPVGIEGIWSKNEIMIQNTGNAMNYYVQLAACDQKYIRLVKQK